MKTRLDTNVWRDYRLGDLVSITTGKLDSNAAKTNGQYPFFTCSRETFQTNTYSFDCECVLLAGNNAAGIFPIKYFKGKFDAYQRTYVILSTDKRRLINRFLFYLLQPKLEFLKSVSIGVATKFLTLTILKDLNLSIPSLDIQEKIAAILSAYDDLIENNIQRIKILEEMAQTIYREWFVMFRFPGHQKVKMVDSPLGKIPEGWKTVTIGDILTLEYGKGLTKKNRYPGPYPVVGSSGISGWHNESSIAGPGVVVGRAGNAGDVHWIQQNFFPIDSAFYVRTIDHGVGLRYLYFVLSELDLKRLVSGAAVPGINRNSVYAEVVLRPQQSLLDSFEKQSSNLFDQAHNLRTKVELLRRTCDILLPKLISGELDVSELDIFIPEAYA